MVTPIMNSRTEGEDWGLPPWMRRAALLVAFAGAAMPFIVPFLPLLIPLAAAIYVAKRITSFQVKEETTNGPDDKKTVVVGLEPIPPKKVVSAEQERLHEASAKEAEKRDKKNGEGENSKSVKDSKASGQVGGAAILAKLRAARRNKKPVAKPMTVLYGSQTGTAAEVAKNISASIEALDLPSRVQSMNEFGFQNVTQENCPYIIWVVSSTGDGEAPDNASRFFTSAKKKSNNENLLSGIQFSCIGLGDSNYTRFMHVPRTLKNRFLEMGAKPFYAPLEADEVDGIEEIIDTWLEGLWPAVKQVMKPEEKQGASMKTLQENACPPLPSCSIEIEFTDHDSVDPAQENSLEDGANEFEYSVDHPFLSTICGTSYMTSEKCRDERRVIHMEFDIAGSGIEYHPGDSIGLMPENDKVLVDSIISHLDLDPNRWFIVRHKRTSESSPETRALQHIKWPCSVQSAFLHGVDLTSPPKKSLLRVMAEYCSDAREKENLLHLCSRAGRRQYIDDIIKRKYAFCDLLFDNKSCKPPLDVLLDALPPLAPRMYSVSASPCESPNKIEVAFTVVEYESNGKSRKGIATSWLENKAQSLLSSKSADNKFSVPIFLRKGGVFSPPARLDVPWIMIGPGTGVSPFRGFLQERRNSMKHTTGPVSECWLFFGCRNKMHDYIYGKELESFADQGILSSLQVAESRKDPMNKVYVQHLMIKHASHLRDLIATQGAYIFICGDGANMVHDVHEALIDILNTNEDRKSAEQMLVTMTKEGRYVKDVWS